MRLPRRNVRIRAVAMSRSRVAGRPFVAEGMDRGERAVHIVDPSKRSAHLQHLGASGIDVRAATDRRLLEVRTWPDFYLVDGRFEPDRTVARLKDVLDEGRGLGFRATRAIGF